MRLGKEALILSATSVAGPFSSYKPERQVFSRFGVSYEAETTEVGSLQPDKSIATPFPADSTYVELLWNIVTSVQNFMSKVWELVIFFAKNCEGSYLYHNQRSRHRCRDLFLFIFISRFKHRMGKWEIQKRTWSARSYDDYFFPSMVGGLAVLRRVNYLAFKRVLFPSTSTNQRSQIKY